MSIRYINRKGNGCTETVDELDSADFPSWRAFTTELKRLVAEYCMGDPAGEYYRSQRACADWKD